METETGSTLCPDSLSFCYGRTDYRDLVMVEPKEAQL